MPTGAFLIRGLTIVLSDLLLAGDNALVIAMAVRSLPRRERRIGSACGAALAVILRIALTILVVEVLRIPYLELCGGLLILWIAYKVLADAGSPHEAAAPHGLLKAIGYVVLADITMSLDNILVIAAVSNGHFALIAFGLCLSIPFVIFSSNLLVELMDRFPIVIYLGAAILAQVGSGLALSDPFLVRVLPPNAALKYGIEAALIAVILIAGRARQKSRKP